MRNYNNQRQRVHEKRHLSVVCRDYEKDWVHCNGINSIALRPRTSRDNRVNVFTASRDRLIKLWDVDYSKAIKSQGQPGQPQSGVNLLVDLDSHTDWVNQVKLIEPANTLISCSNDTTIKIWRLKSNQEYEQERAILQNSRKGAILRQNAYSTFNDHEDYVRKIDYSQSMGRLFSASDDGKLFMWDLHVEKILQKYNSYDEESKERKQDKSKAERFVP